MFVVGGCETDIGATRRNNQDAIAFRKYEKNGNTFAMGIVCDGIGGTRNGEVASYAVLEAANKWFDSIIEWIDPDTADGDVIFAHFKDAAEAWNISVRDLIVCQNVDTGTTMSAIIILRDYYYIIHVGDSRIYKYRDELEQLTSDESVAGVTEKGMKFFLANYMGRNYELSFKTYEGTVKTGDMFMYCSDGFYHTIEPDDARMIYQCVKDYDIQTICLRAIKDRVEKGERDNISVGIVYCEGEA